MRSRMNRTRAKPSSLSTEATLQAELTRNPQQADKRQGTTAVTNSLPVLRPAATLPATPASLSGTQTTQDDFIIEFNDDYEKRTSNTNSGNAQQDDDRQDSYGLEDEYYDLDGF